MRGDRPTVRPGDGILEHGARLAQATLETPARHPRTAVVIGRLLGAAFLVCFATGLYSHFIQAPLPGMAFPSRPEWLYRVTQGVHVTAGIACIPLLLGKLYTVFPLLFAWPPVKTLLGLLERASIALFVASSLVQLAIGLLNTFQWYPWPFSYRATHFALAWIIVASLALHIGVKLPIIARWWRRRDSVDDDGRLLPVGPAEGELREHVRPSRGITGFLQRRLDRARRPTEPVSRRTLVGAVGIGTAVAVVGSAGQTVPALAPLDVFGPRQVGRGPQNLPVNKTARAAGVLERAKSPDWSLTVSGAQAQRTLTLADLRGMPQTTVVLPIACVEGWSTSAEWRGVRFRDLAALVGASRRPFSVRSLQVGAYAHTLLEANFVDDPLTLVALEVNGAVLHLDHGFPARLIAPARPGVLQTKWLAALEAR
ncbi:molybdopterin-dependent oxidoreductase [uncultured Amnibacterium sp.]|uniref:molybdopterin-dependent oxidoreductase n=1 Tax=uncultured Amnibacterium sp. TaxID=1631851 RepID=UPI0035CBC64A